MIKIYTDGSCNVKNRIGGWAAILLRLGRKDFNVKGACKDTTSQRMELQAVIEGIKAVKQLEPSETELEIYSDSSYVINAFNKKWLYKWVEEEFLLVDGKKRINADLWNLLYNYSTNYKIKWIKVKGHSDNQYNNKCDWFAGMERRKLEGKEVG